MSGYIAQLIATSPELMMQLLATLGSEQLKTSTAQLPRDFQSTTSGSKSAPL